jgi:hypothetical protein
VSLLEPFVRREGEPMPQPVTEEVDGEIENEIESILDSKINYNRLYYLVKWVGWSDAHNEWLAASELLHASEAVALFHQNHPSSVGPEDPSGAQSLRTERARRPRGRPRKKGSTRGGASQSSSAPRGRPRKSRPSEQPDAAQQGRSDNAQRPDWSRIKTSWMPPFGNA